MRFFYSLYSRGEPPFRALATRRFHVMFQAGMGSDLIMAQAINFQATTAQHPDNLQKQKGFDMASIAAMILTCTIFRTIDLYV